jgi:hypothetical protein
MPHTPGPWAYDPTTHHIVSTTVFEDYTDGLDEKIPKRVLCTYGAMGGDDTNADLALIVAAPLMFRVIELAKLFVQKCPDTVVTDDMLEIFDHVIAVTQRPASTI